MTVACQLVQLGLGVAGMMETCPSSAPDFIAVLLGKRNARCLLWLPYSPGGGGALRHQKGKSAYAMQATANGSL